MPGIRVFADEVIEKAMRRFKKQVEKAGVVSDLRKREHYEKPSIRLKKKSAAARKRELKNKRRFGA
jgi:small subunit ribosomal protein S21